MKYLCAGCERLVEAGRFRSDGATLALTCPRCGAETPHHQAAADVAPEVPPATAPAAAPPPAPPPGLASSPRLVALRPVPPPSPEEDPFAVPEGHCPKCVAPRREGALSCTQCGLVFANALDAEHHPSPEMLAAVRDLATRWEDPAAHERLVAAALARGELALAGRLYRIRLARQPQDAFAQRGRDEVLRLASTAGALAVPAKEEPGTARRVGTYAVALVILAAVLFGLVATARQMMMTDALP